MSETFHLPGRPSGKPHPGAKTLAKLVIEGTTVLLLMSQGAAIVAAPLLISALWWAYRSSTRFPRLGIAFLAGLVDLEVAWYLTYTTVGENPWIMGPAIAVGFGGTIITFWIAGSMPER